MVALRLRTLILALLLVGGSGMAAGAGALEALTGSLEGDLTMLLHKATWEPDCAPLIMPRRDSKAEVDVFRAQLRREMDCIDDQAKGDAQTLVAVIAEGRKKAYADLNARIARW